MPMHPGGRGLCDDAAVLEIGGETLVLTHDAMAEGTHWRPDADPADIAFKLVTTNLSDLAAKGAEPLGVMLSYTLDGKEERFLEGLNEALTAFDTPLLGGDTITTKGPRTLGLTAIGRARHTPVPSRAGAQIGDGVYITGMLGRAMMGFEGDSKHLAAFNRPAPRLSEGCALAPHVTAMMDISDGLLLDAFRMADASAVTLAVDSAAVPVADVARRMDAMRWGDDYELLFTLPDSETLPVTAKRIGMIEPRGFAPLMIDGEPVVNADGLGFEHS